MVRRPCTGERPCTVPRPCWLNLELGKTIQWVAKTLTEQMKVKRLEFAHNHADWMAPEWSNVIFSNETNFFLVWCKAKIVRRGQGQDREGVSLG